MFTIFDLLVWALTYGHHELAAVWLNQILEAFRTLVGLG